MAKGGARPGAGRPKGSTNIPQFRDFISTEAREEFVAFILERYKKDIRLAVWVGDQLFGKAQQPITGADGGPIQIQGVEITVRR